MKRFRTAMLLLFTGILGVLMFFGSQLQVRTVFAVPSFTRNNPAPLGTNTCAGSGCHVNIGSPGSAVVTGFPSGMTYTPGTPIPLTVTVNDTTQSRLGFELTARLVSNTANQAGAFTAGTGSNLGQNVPQVVQGLGNTPTFSFVWTPPATASGNVNFYLTGLAGSFPNADLYTAMYTLTPAAAAPAPNFALSASSVTVTAGASGSSNITVTPQNGFTGSVALSASGLPSGVTASFNPASTTGTSSLTLTASSAAAAGTSTVTITGTSGSLSHTATLSLTVNGATTAVPNFSLSASPSSLTITQGSSGSSTITITPSGGFNSNVSLSVPGLPSGVTASFNPASATGSSALTLTASSTAASLTVGVTITGTSGSLTHTTSLSLTVNAAAGTSTLTSSPSSLTFNFQGGGSMPPSQKLTLTTGGAPLSYSASSSGGPWLTTNPTGGTTPGSVMVSVNPTNMSAGSYSGMVHLTASGGNNSNVPITLNITSQRGCGTGCGGSSKSMYAEPYVNDTSSSGTLAALWVDRLGIPTDKQMSTLDQGLVLSKSATAPTGSQTGALIKNVQGSLTELGFDYRDNGQCTATSPRFVVVTTDSVTHVVGGCSKGVITAAPAMGWKRVRFKLTDSAIQTSPAILPGDSVLSITLVMDQGPETGPTAAGGLVVIDNIDINGSFVGKGQAAPTYTHRDD